MIIISFVTQCIVISCHRTVQIVTKPTALLCNCCACHLAWAVTGESNERTGPTGASFRVFSSCAFLGEEVAVREMPLKVYF